MRRERRPVDRGVGERASEERGHAGRFVGRMLFLEGTPDVHVLDAAEPDGTVRGVPGTQLRPGIEARDFGVQARGVRRGRRPGHLFRLIPGDEETHVDDLGAQLSRIEVMGEPLSVARHVSAGDG